VIKIIQLQTEGILQKGDIIEVGDNATRYSVLAIINAQKMQVKKHIDGKVYSVYTTVPMGNTSTGAYVW
jgi:hypothetical protein